MDESARVCEPEKRDYDNVMISLRVQSLSLVALYPVVAEFLAPKKVTIYRKSGRRQDRRLPRVKGLRRPEPQDSIEFSSVPFHKTKLKFINNQKKMAKTDADVSPPGFFFFSHHSHTTLRYSTVSLLILLSSTFLLLLLVQFYPLGFCSFLCPSETQFLFSS